MYYKVDVSPAQKYNRMGFTFCVLQKVKSAVYNVAIDRKTFVTVVTSQNTSGKHSSGLTFTLSMSASSTLVFLP
jgi:hypothetical protein